MARREEIPALVCFRGHVVDNQDPCRGLLLQPLSRVSLEDHGLLRESGGRHRARAFESPIQPERVSEVDGQELSHPETARPATRLGHARQRRIGRSVHRRVFVPGLVDGLSLASLPARSGLLFAGVALFGVGSALYIGAGLGAGPRDSMMLVLASRSGFRIGIVRAAIAATVLVLGFVLGGTAGIGTAVVAVLVGPTVEASFWLVCRIGLAAPTGTPEAVV
jgi:hypothetical protein